MSSSSAPLDVVAAAIVASGRVLAARRAKPERIRGAWELPGGKVHPGETVRQAVVREVREELGCEVAYARPLPGRRQTGAGAVLTAHLARIVSGEPAPSEHDALRWLSAEELDDVDWLPADRGFLAELRELLPSADALIGGNVGGAVRVGRTVRRETGPWTPAVHALLQHLRSRGLRGVPRAVGSDALGREALTYLPGSVAWQDGDDEPVEEALLEDAMRWLRDYHRAVSDFRHPGPWRNGGGLDAATIVCHHDFAPYNVAVSSSAHGPRVVGVFDWDMSGPGRPLQDVAFAAWNWVPLWRPMRAEVAARRLQLMATAYGRGDPQEVGARGILDAVVPRIQRSITVIGAGQAAGDPGMLNLANVGEPARTAASLDALRARIPAIAAALA
jgi:mutator protein MutT